MYVLIDQFIVLPKQYMCAIVYFQASFDAGIDFDDIGELDPHTVAGI